jgi:4-hydroxybenzoate polyprenyltransferase
MQTVNWKNNSFFKLLVYANVFIAFCALSQVFLTYKVFPIPVNFKNNSYLLFVLLSTFLQYNVQRGYMISQNNYNTPRSQWLFKHKKSLFVSIIISIGTVLFLCNSLSYLSIGIMVGAEVVSSLYYLPPFNLRKHGYIKPFLIALIWVVSCGLVPLIENDLLTLNTVWFLVAQFFLVASLCVLFDVKDAEDDFLKGINTYANKFGIKTAKLLCIILLIGFCFCSLYFGITRHHHPPFYWVPTIVVDVTATALVLLAYNKHSFYYYLIVDGMLLLQAILVYMI